MVDSEDKGQHHKPDDAKAAVERWRIGVLPKHGDGDDGKGHHGDGDDTTSPMIDVKAPQQILPLVGLANFVS